MNLAALVPDFLKGAFNIIDKAVPDKDLAQQIKAQIAERSDNLQLETIKAQQAIIVAEAQNGSFLSQNWRPITMLVFVVLVSAHWLGFTPENIGEAEVLALLDIVQVGLGGYVIGRSGEKMVKAWKDSK